MITLIYNFTRNIVHDNIKHNFKRVTTTFSDPELGNNTSFKKLGNGYYILNGIHYDQNHNVCHFKETAFENV